MSTNNKNWSYQKQSVEDIYEYLKQDGRFINLKEKKAYSAVKHYLKFCNKFKESRIPDTLGIHYISSVKPGSTTNCFVFSFKGERYLFTKDNTLKMIALENTTKRSSITFNISKSQIMDLILSFISIAI